MGTLHVLWGPRARRWTFRAVLGASVVVAVFAYGVPLWYHAHGERILVVTGQSMTVNPDRPRPNAFNVGDAVVIAPVSPSELKPGLVVTFWPIGHDGQLTTHRIIDLVELPDLYAGTDTPIKAVDGSIQKTQFIRTGGDHNEDIDPNLTPVANVRGVVVDVKPGWGYPLGYAHSALGRLLVFGPPLVLLLLAEMMSWRRRPPRAGATAVKHQESRDVVATSV